MIVANQFSQLFFVGVAFLTLTGFSQNLWAASSEKIISEYQKTKSQVVQVDEKQRQVLASIYAVNKSLKKIISEKATLDSEKMIVESSTKDLAKRILELTTKTKNQKSLLRDRLVTIYKLGGPGVARFLLSSQSSSELDRDLKILGRIAGQDLELIKDYNDSTTELSQKQIKFTARLTTLKNLEEKIKSQEQSLAEENTRKEKILSDLRHSQSREMAKLLKLREKSRKSLLSAPNEEISSLIGPAFFEQKGGLPKPIRAPITQGFGLIKDEIHQVILSHKGVFFSARKGTPVASVFQGTVAYAGELAGFGRTIIIDHGDHYYTVYGDNQELKVSVGDSVRQNQTIALSGISSENFGTGLYFEVRHFSEPSDPRPWMKGSL